MQIKKIVAELSSILIPDITFVHIIPSILITQNLIYIHINRITAQKR